MHKQDKLLSVLFRCYSMPIFGALLLCLLPLCLQAGVVDTLSVPSASMHKEITTVVISPTASMGPQGRRCPTIYLLHGYSGDAFSWLKVKPNLPELADSYGVRFVCPDAENSWYWDAPAKPGSRFETFVVSELLPYIDQRFLTISSREARAITGLSMGGHGALWLAIRHKDCFGAAGSTSGGVDIRPFSTRWEMAKLLGDITHHRERWNRYTVMTAVETLLPGELSLIIDCGESDFFIEVNRQLHRKLLARGIGHDFITRPGGHTAAYWRNSLDFQLLFFSHFFVGVKELVL